MRIQLWSYNYAPEPQGIAPLSTMVAEELVARGHDVLVVAAHPHYPEPAWGTRVKPYRQRKDGVRVLRLPLAAGRGSSVQRVLQEISFAASQSLATPLLPPADVVVAVTPSFPALAPAMAFAKAHRIPWVMWLQDIVTDGAVTTGELDERNPVLRAARLFERRSYLSAAKVVVISEAFRENLVRKGVPYEHIERIFNPSSRKADGPNDIDALLEAPPMVLAMGNIGHSQGLEHVVDAWEANEDLAAMGAKLVIAGGGVAAEQVRERITTDRVEMPGVLYGDELEPVLRGASVGLVSQRADITEFNLPSKLMNYFAYGLPVIASVKLGTETGKIVEEAGGGWVTDAADPALFAARAAEVLRDGERLKAAGLSGYGFAQEQFAPASVAERFEQVLEDAVGSYGA